MVTTLPVVVQRHFVAINICGRKLVDGLGSLPVCRLRTLKTWIKLSLA